MEKDDIFTSYKSNFPTSRMEVLNDMCAIVKKVLVLENLKNYQRLSILQHFNESLLVTFLRETIVDEDSRARLEAGFISRLLGSSILLGLLYLIKFSEVVA